MRAKSDYYLIAVGRASGTLVALVWDLIAARHRQISCYLHYKNELDKDKTNSKKNLKKKPKKTKQTPTRN